MILKTDPPDCVECGQTIDFYHLDKKVNSLTGLSADDFNICHTCVTVIEGNCCDCGGSVYVPSSLENAELKPDLCPECRHSRWEETGEDPGWVIEKKNKASK